MKHWNENELEFAIKLLKLGKNYSEIGDELNKTYDSVRNKLSKLGFKYKNEQQYNINKTCLNCNKEFETLRSSNKKFCNHSCSASYNNKIRYNHIELKNEVEKVCLNCGVHIKKRSKNFCSNKCQGNYTQKLVFEKIKNGDLTFSEKRYKCYLIELYGNKCMECGWAKVNPKTGKIPIQLEHIDGHSENNDLKNLKLLCPNCHSLTSTYGSLNKGNGRKYRYKK